MLGELFKTIVWVSGDGWAWALVSGHPDEGCSEMLVGCRHYLFGLGERATSVKQVDAT